MCIRSCSFVFGAALFSSVEHPCWLCSGVYMIVAWTSCRRSLRLNKLGGQISYQMNCVSYFCVVGSDWRICHISFGFDRKYHYGSMKPLYIR